MKRINANIRDDSFAKLYVMIYSTGKSMTDIVQEAIDDYVIKHKDHVQNGIHSLTVEVSDTSNSARLSEEEEIKPTPREVADKDTNNDVEKEKEKLWNWYLEHKNNQYTRLANGKLYVKCKAYKDTTNETLNGKQHNKSKLFKPSCKVQGLTGDCYVMETPTGQN